MAILEEDVVRVRQSTDLVALVGEHAALKKVGRRWVGLCPFHGEKTPSFSVNAEEGLYLCFGCQARGDAITFVREIEHSSFVEAVEQLAARSGIELRHDSEAAGRDRKRRKSLSDAMEHAVEWYHQRLLTAPDAGNARAYLRDRGYDGDVVRRFRIGWAPDDWDSLARALRLPADVLRETGLGFENRRGRPQDSFRGRVLFPIFDPSGAPVAFGGRVLPGGDGPKYKNSPESALYTKSRTLYGLNWAKAGVVKQDQVIVCEGYTDVIAFFQAGAPRAVATCGTALTEHHVRTLKNFANRVVLAYDADTAGKAAAERFYEWEQTLGIDIGVLALPADSDPADLARRDPAALVRAVDEAEPFLAFRLGQVFRSGDRRTVEGRTRLAARAVAMIAEHPTPAVRHQYLQQVEGWSRVPIDELARMLVAGPDVVARDGRTGSRVVDVRSSPPRQTPEAAVLPTELAALRLAVHHPEHVVAVLERIVPAGSEGVEDVLFEDERARAAFHALMSSSTLHEAVANADPETADVLTRLVVEEGEGAAGDEYLRLVDRAAGRAIRRLEVDARSNADGPSRAGPAMAWLKLEVEQLRHGATPIEAAAAVIGWLMEQAEADRLLDSEPVEPASS